MISLCRAILRQEDYRVPTGGSPSFAKRVRSLALSEELARALTPLLETHEHVCKQIDTLDAHVAARWSTSENEFYGQLTPAPLANMSYPLSTNVSATPVSSAMYFMKIAMRLSRFRRFQ